MRSLLSLLVVVLVVFMLSKLLVSNAPVSHRDAGGDASRAPARTSDVVRERVNSATDSYQQSLEESMEAAGAATDQ